MKVISVDKVLEASKGAVGLRAMLAHAGQPVPRGDDTISLWKFRRRLPVAWVGAVLFALHASAGIDPLDLLVEDVDAELDL